MILLYVDDILCAGINIKKIIKKLKRAFKVKYLGEINTFLGIVFEYDVNGKIQLSQIEMIEKALKLFRMTDCIGSKVPMEQNFVYDKNSKEFNEHLYRSLIGCLSYIALSTRPDIQFSVSYLSRYLNKPNIQLWKAAKRILRYLKETKYLKLTFKRNLS